MEVRHRLKEYKRLNGTQGKYQKARLRQNIRWIMKKLG